MTRANLDFSTGAGAPEVAYHSGRIHSTVGTAINTKKGHIGNPLKDIVVTHRTVNQST